MTLCLHAALAADEKSPFKDQKEKLGYCLGMNIAGSLKAQSVEVDIDQICKGLKDSFAGDKTLLTQQEMQQVLNSWQMEMRNKRMEQQKAVGDKSRKEGEAFLAENAKKPGVITLPSGLQYKVLASGTGKTPTTNDTVRTHYRGTLTDGTEFDSSYTRGQPFVAQLGRGVIPGWTEALTKMKVGDKWQLFIPSALAYGEFGRRPKIGPNAVLIFEMELLGIEEPKEAGKAAVPEKK